MGLPPGRSGDGKDMKGGPHKYLIRWKTPEVGMRGRHYTHEVVLIRERLKKDEGESLCGGHRKVFNWEKFNREGGKWEKSHESSKTELKFLKLQREHQTVVTSRGGGD